MTNPLLPSTIGPLANALTSTNAFVVEFQPRSPTSYDSGYPLQKFWFNTVTNDLWFLKSFSSTTGQVLANWIKIGGATVVEDLQGNIGGPVPPNGSSIIFVVGDATTITTDGNPATNTLTISSGPTVATLYTEDSGTAVPALGNLNVKGSAGITTSGAGSTVTITAGPTIATTYTEDVGTATPALNNLNIVGGTGIQTVGSGSTVTINALGSGFSWVEVSTNTVMVKNTGYFVVSPGGAITMTLPAVSVIGDSVSVSLVDATSWQILQPNAGSVIRIGNSTTTVGMGGSIESTASGDSIELVCRTSNGEWVAQNWVGNLTIL